MSWFVVGLRKEVQGMVCLLQPRHLHGPYALTRLSEDNCQAHFFPPTFVSTKFPAQQTPRSAPFSSSSSSSYTSSPQFGGPKGESSTTTRLFPLPILTKTFEQAKPPPPWTSRTLNNKEIDELHAKGLCFGCKEKFKPSHRCAK